MTAVSIRVGAIVFDPVTPGGLGTNALYVDSSSGALSSKGGTGATAPVGASSTTANSVLTKILHNRSGFTIQAGMPFAKKSDGTIIAAAAGTVGDMVVLGTTLETILNNAQGLCQLIGPNVPGVLTGLGFAPGDAVYLGDGGGYTNTTSTLTFNTDSIVRMGYADCAAGVASAVATDLIMFAEVVSVL